MTGSGGFRNWVFTRFSDTGYGYYSRDTYQNPVSLFSQMKYPFLVWRRGGVRWVEQAEISLFSVQQTVPHKDDPVEVLLVPLLVRDHDDGLPKLPVHGPEELQYSP